MNFNSGRTPEDQEAASIVVALNAINNKREREQQDDSAARTTKQAKSLNGNTETADAIAAAAAGMARLSENERSETVYNHEDCGDDAVKKPAKKSKKDPADAPLDATGVIFSNAELKPAPFFYYSDHSLEPDDDPLTPVTAAGRVPTFPAKMHAILTNPKLRDVIAWAPNGRSWRILKPRDFEVHVLPKYFEHSKFSSFVRQANGWGFRRLSQGRDRNAYYHEYFLRSMPWLCKKMRRPKVAEKKAIDPEMEPDFDAISAMLPVPNKPIGREIMIVQETIEKGPRARMPVHWATTPLESLAAPVATLRWPSVAPAFGSNNMAAAANTSNNGGSTATNLGDLKPSALPGNGATNTFSNVRGNINALQLLVPRHNNTLASGNNNSTMPSSLISNVASSVAASDNSSDSQYAAGFMAATAYHSQQIRNVFGTAFVAGMPIPSTVTENLMSNPASAFGLLQRGMGNFNTSNLDNSSSQVDNSTAMNSANINSNFGINGSGGNIPSKNIVNENLTNGMPLPSSYSNSNGTSHTQQFQFPTNNFNNNFNGFFE